MESAIAPELRCPRTRDRRIGEDFIPSFPAWTARDDAHSTQCVMAYFGVQWRTPAHEVDALIILDEFLHLFQGEGGALNVEQARFVDKAGWNNLVTIGYWPTPEAYETWWRTHQGWWNDPAREASDVGLYREIFLPHKTHLETLFNTNNEFEGVGTILGSFSDSPIQEHSYWGGMRDRLPASQTDELHSSGERRIVEKNGQRLTILGHQGMTLIRSGQDCSLMQTAERELYFTRIEPTLIQGMNFLRDEGLAIGCYFNRFMRICADRGGKAERSFGMSVWHTLSDLEHWAEHHPTHKAIFNEFLTVVQALKGQLELRVFHEVAVLHSDNQIFEYIGCHPETGMLNGLVATS
ncbi:aldoxime dehydratase [Neokomagataea thailandica NBRC 106555]|uniref:Phenylacetaldoxime dehydratase family protein n=2 Tax=Neokomagataea TaxID=1223423 RepID=A0A4Y6V9C6_9PROT|nr:MULTISPECIES: phenylacetaldoxime dehydratase family protein [Neokomagataea]QDH25211.1 phenylacetaldoxime dehydratase family protein [Neokomagataea tanensis]GBR54056.1 aldoxime dehydratase [Neokomagataea thailandica NBRC 106555]